MGVIMKKNLLIVVPGFLLGISTGFASPDIDPVNTTFSGTAFQLAAGSTDEVDPSVSDQTFSSQNPDEVKPESEGMEEGSASGIDSAVDVEGFDSQDQTGLTDEPRTDEMNVEGSSSSSEENPAVDVEGFDSQDHVGLEDEPRTEELGAEDE
jgi:hypothetical protein